MVAGTGPRGLVALDARLVGGQSTGDSTYWTGLLRGLGSLETDLRFLLLSNAPRPHGIPENERFVWQTAPGRGRWWSLVRFPLAARRAGARALHTQYSLSPLAGRSGVTTIHDVSFLIGPEWFRPRDRILLQQTVPSSARRAARVITVSETSREEIERLIPGSTGKVRVTPPAGHPEIVPMERQAARALLQDTLGFKEPYLLTVGTRWPRKNMALALRAVERLPQALPHRLVVTGKAGWGDEPRPERALSSGYVDFRTLSALYSAAELYLAPSRHEGFGMTLIEAFSCGCPVMCSSGGALPETAGGAAIVTFSWDPVQWAEAIRVLLADSSKLAELSARGKERSKRFTWQETARKTLDVYREVLG